MENDSAGAAAPTQVLTRRWSSVVMTGSDAYRWCRQQKRKGLPQIAAGLLAVEVLELDASGDLEDARSAGRAWTAGSRIGYQSRQLAEAAGLGDVHVAGIVEVIDLVEVRVIEHIEGVGAKLKYKIFGWDQHKVLGETGVQVEEVRPTQDVAAADLESYRPGEGGGSVAGIGVEVARRRWRSMCWWCRKALLGPDEDRWSVIGKARDEGTADRGYMPAPVWQVGMPLMSQPPTNSSSHQGILLAY